METKKILSILFIFYASLAFCANYYINDATYNAKDIWTTAIGNNTNNGVNGKSAAKPMLTFRGLWTAFGPFANGDVIYVDAGTYVSSVGGSLTQNYGYAITKNITIRGAGDTKTIFDNNYCGIVGSFYFATISGTTACVIRDIQFTKYSSNSDGQAFDISNATVTFTNVLTNTNGGSAKYATISIGAGSNVTITGGGLNCAGDIAHGASGGIDIKGNNINLNISNTSFIGNYKSSSAQIGNGASITMVTCNNVNTIVNINNCLFSGCAIADDLASGGTFFQTSGILNVTDCIIDDSQTAQGSLKYGGTGYFTGGTTVFTRVKVINCTNSGASTYGNFAVTGGNLKLNNCYFTGNRSDRGNDIFCNSGIITSTNTYYGSIPSQAATFGGTITLTNCNIPSDLYSSGTFSSNNLASAAFVTPTVPTFTGVCATGVVLPITLKSFTGQNINKYNLLEWVTSSEINNDYFIVEKIISEENDFETIGNVNAAGNSFIDNCYMFNDCHFENKINYYRLKQIDFDGKITNLRTISIDNREKEKKKITMMTNLLGEEVNENYRGLIIILFSDGSSQKVLR